MNTILLLIFICLILLPIVVYIIQKNNMAYYQLNGRDNSEIEAWLKSRKWFSSFKRNVEQEYTSVDEINAIIFGKNDTLTIANAFCWKDTPEGTEYWGKREHEFLAWYFGQYVDFHLLK